MIWDFRVAIDNFGIRGNVGGKCPRLIHPGEQYCSGIIARKLNRSKSNLGNLAFEHESNTVIAGLNMLHVSVEAGLLRMHKF